MRTEDTYDKPKSFREVAHRRGSMPGTGAPVPTGYYPNMSGSPGYVVGENEVYDQLYRASVVGSLDCYETIDQHPWIKIDQTWVPPENTERPSGHQDWATDGPAPPTLANLSLHYRRQAGASITQYMDVPGHKFPKNGSQDGSSWTTYQDVTRALQPYDPSKLDANGQMPDTLQTLPPSPPHGWTSRPAVNAQAALNAKAATLVQQQPVRAERLANSTYAGQTYSQTTARDGGVPGATFGTVHSRRGRG